MNTLTASSFAVADRVCALIGAVGHAHVLAGIPSRPGVSLDAVFAADPARVRRIPDAGAMLRPGIEVARTVSNVQTVRGIPARPVSRS